MWQEHVVASVCIPKEMGHFTEEHVVGNMCRGTHVVYIPRAIGHFTEEHIVGNTCGLRPQRDQPLHRSCFDTQLLLPQVIVVVDGTAVRGLEF